MQLKSQPPTAIQACQHAAHCGWKTQCFCQEGLLHSQAVIYTLQLQDCGKYPQRSPLSLVKLLAETFRFSARTKMWFVLIRKIKINKKEKGWKEKIYKFFCFSLKRKSMENIAKLPLPLLSNVKAKCIPGSLLEILKKQAIQEIPIKHFQEFLFSLRIYCRETMGTRTVHHIRLSKHT